MTYGNERMELLMMEPTYEIVSERGVLGIRCLLCGLTSWNQLDVLQLYCGKCHRYHYPKHLINEEQ
jgi:uncharacterized OB-fold protein